MGRQTGPTWEVTSARSHMQPTCHRPIPGASRMQSAPSVSFWDDPLCQRRPRERWLQSREHARKENTMSRQSRSPALPIKQQETSAPSTEERLGRVFNPARCAARSKDTHAFVSSAGICGCYAAHIWQSLGVLVCFMVENEHKCKCCSEQCSGGWARCANSREWLFS